MPRATRAGASARGPRSRSSIGVPHRSELRRIDVSLLRQHLQGKVKTGATRVLKESDQPILKMPLGLCQPQRKLKKIDFTGSSYLGCYVPPDQLAFAL
jgi:hypothetical protein